MQWFVFFLADLLLRRNIAIPEKVSTLLDNSMRNCIISNNDMNFHDHDIKLYNSKVYKYDCNVVKSVITSGENELGGQML